MSACQLTGHRLPFVLLLGLLLCIRPSLAADQATNQATEQPAEEAGANPTTPLPPVEQASRQPPTADTDTAADTSANPAAPETLPDKPRQAASADQSTAQQNSTSWHDSHPDKIQADWLQLASGEWLRGRIITMQGNKLEFHSDQLKDVSFKWKKVRYLKSYQPYNLRFKNNVLAIGNIEVSGDSIIVSNAFNTTTYDRHQLETIASARDDELSNWVNKITFNINAKRGNTVQTEFSARYSAKRRTVHSRSAISYLGHFTRVEHTQTINNHRLNANVDVFMSSRLFYTPVITEYFRDPFQNIETRVNAGFGLGYYLYDSDDSEWTIFAGPGYQYSRYSGVAGGESRNNGTIVALLNTEFNTALSSRVNLEGKYGIIAGDDRVGNYTHHSIFSLVSQLTDTLDLDISFIWDYVHKPITDAAGNTPLQDDFRMMFGLGFAL